MGNVRRLAAMGLLAAAFLASACNPLPATVAGRSLTPITRGEIRRIAVLPFTAAGLAPDREAGAAGEAAPVAPADTVTRAVLTAMREQPQWQIVDELTVGEAMRQQYGEVRAPTPEEARAVGTLLGADAVLRGDVRTWEERIGTELAAKRPASVRFGIELVRPADGSTLWQGEYAERQQSLSENLWNLPGFVRAGGTWVRARELAAIGATRIVARLHEALYGPPPKRTRGRRR
jgi:TolB-like protein